MAVRDKPRCLRGQALAPLGAAARNDLSAVFGRHARPETVTAFANYTAGLECLFLFHQLERLVIFISELAIL